MQNMTLIFDHYSTKQSKCNQSKSPNTVLIFIKEMTPLINDNIFDQHLSEYSYNQKSNVILQKKQYKVQLAQYLHATCLSPTPSTFIKAINNNHFISWQDLIANLIRKHLPKSIVILQGYMDTERQGLQSTKPYLIENSNQNNLHNDYFPPSDIPNVKTNAVYYALVQPEHVSIAYIDLMGRFPKKKSSRGNEYILVRYYHDGNCILGIPIKNRRGPTIIEAWKDLHKQFK